MSAETLAVLRTNASQEFPMPTIKALTSLVAGGDALANAWELFGHANTLGEYVGALKAGAWVIPGGGLGAANEEEVRQCLTKCIEQLGGDPPALGSSGDGVGAGGLIALLIQLMPLILELLKRKQ